MTDLNRDILYLIFKRLQNDKKTLLLCLSVNRTWCEVIIPILWKNPWKYLKKKKRLLLNVIVSHLSNESKNDLMSQGVDFLIDCYQKPLFDYIKFTHLYIPYQFDQQINLIPGAEQCFSKLVFLSCNTNINDNVLNGLIEICESIQELEFNIEVQNNNYGIVGLIENSKKLFNIRLLPNNQYVGDSFCKILEDSLIQHSNTIEYFKITKQPITNVLSSFINLKVLEMDCYYYYTWNCLKNLSLPFLQILRAKRVPIRALTSLIENTSGYLNEINIDCINHDEFDNKVIIQTICQHCPNLKFLKMLFRYSGTLELEKLLINCKYLEDLPHLDKRDKRPMLLQTISSNNFIINYFRLKEQYKAEKVIEKYDHYTRCGRTFEDFEWS
ncbi:4967_t:CDS:2 [Rhizophagus irregularis]|nr:4967_t:CDS:2 [Rhizophagus irregularis]